MKKLKAFIFLLFFLSNSSFSFEIDEYCNLSYPNTNECRGNTVLSILEDIRKLKEINNEILKNNNNNLNINDLNNSIIKNKSDIDSISSKATWSFCLITLLATLLSFSVVF